MTPLCPCGSKNDSSVCCGSIISGQRDAVTALELMKSRYTAFTQANGDYLLSSHHSSTRPNIKEKAGIVNWAKSVKWVGLTILNTKMGKAADTKGFVEFSAAFMENGEANEIHENSLFQRENGKWVYVSGVHY